MTGRRLPGGTIAAAAVLVGSLLLAPVRGASAAVGVIAETTSPGHAGTDSAGAPEAAETAAGIGGAEIVVFVLAALVLAAFFGRRWSRLPDRPRAPRAFPPGAGALLFIMMFLIASVGYEFGSRLAGIPFPPAADAPLADQVILRLSGYVAQAFVVALLVWLTLRAPRPREDAAKPRPSVAASVALGLLACVAIWPVLQALTRLIALIGGFAPDEIAHDTLRRMIDVEPDRWFVMMTLLVTIGAPVFEEIMYRGLLQRAVRQAGLPGWAAIVIASLVFTGMHWGVAAPHALAVLFVLSLGFGWVYEKTGRLAAPIAMHVLFNAANLAVAMALAE